MTLPDAEEQEAALKHACVIRCNKSRRPAADAETEHHQPELADGGVGEHLLDVRVCTTAIDAPTNPVISRSI